VAWLPEWSGNLGGQKLPARLDVTATAKLLGFAEHDIQILMAVGKLMPLGDPAPDAPKWFAAVEMIQLAADQDWLHKRERRMNPLDVKAGFGPAPASNQTVFSERSEQSRQ
jgi:hypothetical protein